MATTTSAPQEVIDIFSNYQTAQTPTLTSNPNYVTPPTLYAEVPDIFNMYTPRQPEITVTRAPASVDFSSPIDTMDVTAPGTTFTPTPIETRPEELRKRFLPSDTMVSYTGVQPTTPPWQAKQPEAFVFTPDEIDIIRQGVPPGTDVSAVVSAAAKNKLDPYQAASAAAIGKGTSFQDEYKNVLDYMAQTGQRLPGGYGVPTSGFTIGPPTTGMTTGNQLSTFLPTTYDALRTSIPELSSYMTRTTNPNYSEDDAWSMEQRGIPQYNYSMTKAQFDKAVADGVLNPNEFIYDEASGNIASLRQFNVPTQNAEQTAFIQGVQNFFGSSPSYSDILAKQSELGLSDIDINTLLRNYYPGGGTLESIRLAGIQPGWGSTEAVSKLIGQSASGEISPDQLYQSIKDSGLSVQEASQLWASAGGGDAGAVEQNVRAYLDASQGAKTLPGYSYSAPVATTQVSGATGTTYDLSNEFLDQVAGMTSGEQLVAALEGSDMPNDAAAAAVAARFDMSAQDALDWLKANRPGYAKGGIVSLWR